MKPHKIMASRTIELDSPEDLEGITYIQTDLILSRRQYIRDDHYRNGEHENMPLYQTPSSSEYYKKRQPEAMQNNNPEKGVSVNVNAVRVNVMTKPSKNHVQY